jgi:hypothetical protein
MTMRASQADTADLLNTVRDVAPVWRDFMSAAERKLHRRLGYFKTAFAVAAGIGFSQAYDGMTVLAGGLTTAAAAAYVAMGGYRARYRKEGTRRMDGGTGRLAFMKNFARELVRPF